MKITLKKGIDWIGKIDWEIRRFHGHEYTANRGTSYNSYLVRDEKNVLIDTVAAPFSLEFVKNLAEEIALDKIDYVVINHAEPDHSGALKELMRHIPQTTIVCTKNCVDSLRGHYHEDWNFQIVKTGDRLSVGKKDLIFIEAPMIHWPDTMFTYLTVDNVLFSNDAFGQHYASEFMTNDQVSQNDLFAEAMKYYANIVNKFSPIVLRKINEIKNLNLPISMICPSHGIIWKKKCEQIIDKYLEWASDYQENQVTIIYDTMWTATRQMAEWIAKGIHQEDSTINIKLFKVSNSDKNDIITEIFKSKAVLFGSPTLNNGLMSEVAGILEEVQGMAFKKKSAAAFGSYGWSGESVVKLTNSLQGMGFKIINQGLKIQWQPDTKAIKDCIEYGKEVARNI
ncbi:MAG: anaerobic nitric oxide reductase flavorubredoxin [bacterium]